MIRRFHSMICCLVLILGASTCVVFSQPAYWQFSYHDMLPGIRLGMTEQQTISQVTKRKKEFNKYTFTKGRKFVDSAVGYVDYNSLSGEYVFPSSHKLMEWFDENYMIVNYHITFINGVASMLTLFFIYPTLDVGDIDKKYNDLIDFFSQVGWYPFCGHPLWNFDVRCGYQYDFVPEFEDTYGENPAIRTYRHRLKVTKGSCTSSKNMINESIDISFSDALSLQKALKIDTIEKAAFYGNAYFGFGLDKKQTGCISKGK